MKDAQSGEDSRAPKPRGLWGVMRQGDPATDPASADGDSQNESRGEERLNDESAESPQSPLDQGPSEQTTAESEDKTSSKQPAAGRGLWSLMQRQSQSPASSVAEQTSSHEDDSLVEPKHSQDDAENSPEPTAGNRRGLFALMNKGTGDADIDHSPSPATTITSVSRDQPPSRESSLTSKPAESRSDPRMLATSVPLTDDRDRQPSGDDADGEDVPMTLVRTEIDPADLEPLKFRRAANKARRGTWTDLLVGVFAVASSWLAILPAIWASFPATVFGFTAIVSGFLSLTGPARRELSILNRSAALLGMILGGAGIFLGPLYFAEIGREQRANTGAKLTERHLQLVGEGLLKHHDQEGAFPIGGTFSRDGFGAFKGQHGWMTRLLPFLGEAQLFNSINMNVPYDDPVNRVAMGTDIELYFAAGGDRSKIARVYGAAHFAGVGGEVDDVAGLSHLGIFERDAPVRRDEITDGASNTLVIGELAGNYPPWGDPENWRSVGRGLNREVNGFGNKAGNGATFLMADGQVRFFSNKTDPNLLRQLSTRDGGEK